jgi:arylsulfatase A-like enzyme/thioredoxin-like negative regulator of GroEL
MASGYLKMLSAVDRFVKREFPRLSSAVVPSVRASAPATTSKGTERLRDVDNPNPLAGSFSLLDFIASPGLTPAAHEGGCSLPLMAPATRSAALGRGLLIFAAAWLAACGAGPRRSNVLVVTFDTTRADHISAYGNERIETTAVDSLAAEGLLFSNAHSSIALTMPSHTTLLTGLYPTGHGVRDNGLFILADDIVTLPERLKEHGYATAAAISGFPLVKRFNLGQGFELYDDELRRKDEDFLGRRPAQPSLFFEERRGARTNEAILPWLEEHKDGPFFAWIHYYDPHRPWDPPAPYDELYADDPYLAEIAYADECLGQILSRLREWDVLDDTLVIMTADHGEGLGEHNETTHSLLNYETTLRVPLVIRPPGGMAPRRVDDLVGGVDIAPTVLEFLGLEVPPELQGHSLAGYLSGRGGVPANRPFYAETLSPRLSHGWGELRTLYQGGYKYIHGSRPELYDLGRDPHELEDLLAVEPQRAATMREALARLINENAMDSSVVAQPVDEETRAQLMALGYLTGGADSSPIVEELRSDGTPPQDRVVDINLSSEVRNLLTAGQGTAARQVALELLKLDPENGFYRELFAQAALLSGRLEEAAETIEALMAEAGGRGATVGMLITVGARLVRAGQAERGLHLIERAVELDPSAERHYHLAEALREAGDAERAREELLATLDADPNHVPAKVDLAIQYALAGERESARQAFEEALQGDPFYPKGHYNYGAFLLETGETAKARDRFRRAIKIYPDYRAARLALVVAELQLGNSSGAREALQELEAQAPESEETQRARQLVEASRDAE